MKAAQVVISFFLLVSAAVSHAEVVTEVVEYAAGPVTLKGYLAYDNAAAGKRPGVLVVHEWWGNNDYAHRRARMLAELGYTALAVDMYGDGKIAAHPDDAGKFANAVGGNPELAKSRFLAARDVLAKHKTVNPENIAAIGYCFGGGVVLNMARMGVDLKGVASFHGSLGSTSPAMPGTIKTKVLVMNGADDPFVKPEQIEAFKKEMDTAKADYKFINYPGAVHGFTSTEADENGKKFNLPLAYNKSADEASWKEMQLFFNSIFGG